MADADTKQVRGRYRKVEVRTWGDEKFRTLTPMPPSGQGLWLFLITGPHTGPIPGLFRAGRAAMAEELGWEVEAFDEAFREVFRQGMAKADFKARVVWIPNAIKHNRPESPNVVRSWAAEFDLIPECALKWEALDALRASVYAVGESFAKAFDEAFGKASGKPYPKAMPNQEQEQEQEQEEQQSSLRSDSQSPPASAPDDGDLLGNGGNVHQHPADRVTSLVLAAYHELLPNCQQVAVLNPKRRRRIQLADKLARQVCKAQGWVYDADAFWRAYFAQCAQDPWLRGEVANPRNPRWKQNLDVLLAEDRFAEIMDRAVARMGEAA